MQQGLKTKVAEHMGPQLCAAEAEAVWPLMKTCIKRFKHRLNYISWKVSDLQDSIIYFTESNMPIC